MGAYEHSPGCIGDIDDDQVVNTADLILLLGAWGPCPGCPEDLNGDDIVNTADLLLLLGNWGPCGSPGTISPPQSVQDCIQRYGFDPEKLAACIEGMIKAGTP